MSENRQVPVTRINKFFSEEDYKLQISFGREYVESFGNFTLILYRVNRETTNSDSIYGEASTNEIRYFPPVELKVFPTLKEPENKVYNTKDGTNRYLQDGQLLFSIYTVQLDELAVDISFGDYIGYPVTETEIRYFAVVNDGLKNYNNENTIMGYKAAVRNILCAPVDSNEFNAY